MGWVTPRPGRFSSGKAPVLILQEAGWGPEPVWMGEKNLTPPELDPRTAHPVLSRYTDWAILAHSGTGTGIPPPQVLQFSAVSIIPPLLYT